MSIFPRTYFSPETSFTPLFRLLDDFDNYSREVSGSQGGRNSRRAARTFSPRFDVKETETAYELHGELPGIDKENVSIEFTEPQTIVISGRTERHYASGTPPAGLVEGGAATSTPEGGEKDTTTSHRPHQASVADEETEQATVEKGTDAEAEVTKAEQPKKPQEKFWVSERSVGEFSRSFSFPSRVDQDAVVANMSDGVLSVVVPKAKKHESRRIAVN